MQRETKNNNQGFLKTVLTCIYKCCSVLFSKFIHTNISEVAIYLFCKGSKECRFDHILSYF